MIKAEQLGFRYGRCPYVLRNVSFDIPRGSIVGLIGDNGSGKTTLMKLIAGILAAKEGRITSTYKDVGALIEEPALYRELTVKDNLKLYCRLYGRDYSLIDKYIRILGTDNYLHKKISSLSLGMKQRVGVLVALIASQDFVLLDEPTNGLDPTGIRQLLYMIKELAQKENITFVISSHILQNLEQICDSYIFLKNQTSVFWRKEQMGEKDLSEVYFDEA